MIRSMRAITREKMPPLGIVVYEMLAGVPPFSDMGGDNMKTSSVAFDGCGTGSAGGSPKR